MISQSRTPAGVLRTFTAILCLAAILMAVMGSSAWAAPRVVRVVGIQDGISDSQADYFRRTIAELNDLTEDRIFVTRPIPAASSLDLNAYQGLDFAIVSPRVFALLERYNGFIPMASLSVDIPDSEPGAELRPVVSALVFATPDADEDGLAKPHLSDIAGETVTVVKGDEVDTTFLLQNELSSRRLAPVKVRVASDGGTPSEIIRRAVERGDKLFAVSTDLLRETSSDLFSGFVKVDMRVDDETGLVSSVTPMPGRVFAAGLSVARMGLLEFAATLFALDIAPDIRWVRPADYRSVHLAAERMRDPVYMSYQKKTLLEEMREHAAWVILAAAILIGMIWHSVAAERLVRRRSAELMETVKRQQASERQFEALERMTAVSQMSNIVAHELRQPLAAVTNFAMSVRRRIANGTLTADSLEFALGRILAENERASDIVEHVRDYARKRRRQITPVDLTQMSAKVVSSMRASNARVSFESEVPAGLFVEGDSLEIELVLRNLVKNAGESAAQADGVPRVVLAGERIGDEVVITVTDNGPVRTKAEIDAFLVPLRSEKSGGLGLGLAIVRRIIEAYGGTIVFDVVEPQGVRVEARLPAPISEPQHQENRIMEKINLSDLLEPEHMDPVKRIALIRIVDDDGGVRESYKFLIESEGWRVKTYPSAEAFLEEDDPTVPGCGVFDVRMTGITGMELHQKLIELANRLPVIFVSAHGDIEMAVKAMRRGAVDFLTKPVVDEKLLSSIDRAVARSCEEAAEAETVRELAGLWQALSPRECQVAQLAAEGLTTKAVSDVLGIAERTAQVHVAHVCSKLGVENAVGVAQIIARLRARGVLQ